MQNNNHTQGELSSHYDDNGFYFIISDKPFPSPYIAATGGEGSEDEANAAHLAMCWNNHNALVEALREVITHINKQYEAECDDANWYNNNTPNVGISLDYMALPPYPAYAEKAKALLNSLKQ
jgi:hypothetical protein